MNQQSLKILGSEMVHDFSPEGHWVYVLEDEGGKVWADGKWFKESYLCACTRLNRMGPGELPPSYNRADMHPTDSKRR